jgi:hypothetical protein
VAWAGDDASPAAIAQRLDAAAVAEEVIEAFLASIPRYRELPPELLRPVRELAASQIELFVTAVSEGRSPSTEELEPFAHSARQRALEGMPLADLLHAYRLAGRIGWSAITAAVQPGEEAALAPLGALMINHMGRISAAASVAYLDARPELSDDHDRHLRRLLVELCDEAEPGPAARDAADALGFPIQAAYHPFVLTLPGGTASAHAVLATELRGEHVLALAEGEHVIGICRHPLAVEFDGRYLLIIGERTRRGALAGVLDDLRRTVELAIRTGASGRRTLSSLASELLLARSPDVALALRDTILGPLAGSSGRRNAADLIGTLDAYLDSGLDRAETARTLGIHPNTLDKRLQRVATVTGLDLGSATDIARLTLAMAARHVRRGPADE